MSLFANYDSDSSSGDSSKSTENNAINFTTEKKDKIDVSGGLFMAYDDDDDDDASNTIEDEKHRYIENSVGEKSGIRSQKRQKQSRDEGRTFVDNKNKSHANGENHPNPSILPPPPKISYSSSPTIEDEHNPFVDSIYLRNDYTNSILPSQQDQKQSNTSSKLIEMYHSYVKNSSTKSHTNSKNNNSATDIENNFASHLSRQHNFGNPQIFSNIISHFGIHHSYGSNILDSKQTNIGSESSGFFPFEFIEQIVASEEKSRAM